MVERASDIHDFGYLHLGVDPFRVPRPYATEIADGRRSQRVGFGANRNATFGGHSGTGGFHRAAKRCREDYAAVV
jgi:hypothetical protein